MIVLAAIAGTLVALYYRRRNKRRARKEETMTSAFAWPFEPAVYTRVKPKDRLG